MGFGGNPLADGLVSVRLTFCTVNKLSFKGREEILFIYFFWENKIIRIIINCMLWILIEMNILVCDKNAMFTTGHRGDALDQ